MCVCSQQQLVCQLCWMFKALKWLLHWLLLQHTCVCSPQQLAGQPSIDFFCNTHVCVCSQQQLVCKSFRMQECSKPARVFFAPHMCVCAHSSNCRDPHLTFSETHMCMPTATIGRATLDPWVQPSLDLFCNTHMCVAEYSSWPAKVVECSKPSNDFFIDLFCNTHVCAHSSNWSANPQLTSSATHMCVLAAAIGLQKFFECSKPPRDFFAPHMCVCAHSSVRCCIPLKCSRASKVGDLQVIPGPIEVQIFHALNPAPGPPKFQILQIPEQFSDAKAC